MTDNSINSDLLAQLKAKLAQSGKPTVPLVNPEAPPKPNTSRFDNLEDVRVSLNTNSKAWKDSELEHIRIYSVKQLTPTEIIKVGKDLFKTIEDDSFSSSDVDVLLALAVSLLDPESTMQKPVYVLKQLPEKMGHKFREVNVTLPEDTSNTERELTATLERMQANAEGAEGDEEKEQYRKLAESIQIRINNLKAGETQQDEEEEVVEEDAVMYVYPFMAAYILRLYGKTPNSWSDNLKLAKTRMASWYNLRGNPLEELSISESQAEKLREFMSRKQEICSTWVMWCAYAENNKKDLTSSTEGMIRYLATQMFSYTAMHAYSQIIQIQTATGVTFKDILSALLCPATKAALISIASIIEKHEVTEKFPGRKTYFRYARVWDSGYFSDVQTSNCKMLAWVVSRSNQYISGKGLSDPSNIYALKKMDPKMVTTLDGVAEKFYAIIMAKTTKDAETGAAWL